MMTEFECPHCGTLLRVPESKEGRKGRCPVCGAPIRVPSPGIHPIPPEALPKQHRPKMIWAVLAGGVLVIGLCVGVALSRHGKSGTTEEATGLTLTPAQQARLDAQLAEISKLQDVVRQFRALHVKERRLRARNVLMKINSYEPVTDFEYALRRQMLDEEEKAAKSAGNAEGESDPWKLNAPLAPSEKEELGRLSDDLQTQSAALATELRSVGVFLEPVKDSLGRALLDGDEASAKLVARRDSIVENAHNAPP